MTQPAFQLGIKASLMRNTATYGSPTWLEITCVSDLAIKGDWDKAEGSTRASRVKRYAKTLFDLGFSGKVKVDHNDSSYLALLAALYDDTVIDLMALDGDPTDSTLTGSLSGFRFDAHVFKGEQDQGLGNVLFDSIDLMPALSGNSPVRVSVAVTAGVPVYTYTAL